MAHHKPKGLIGISLFCLSLFIFLFLRFGLDFVKKEIRPMDFSIFYAAWQAVLSGLNMYNSPTGEGVVFKYAPYFGIIFSPLALLPYEIAAVAWNVINSAVFVIGLGFFYLIGFKKAKLIHFIVLTFLGVLFIFRSLSPEMHLGNSNLLVLGLFFLFLYFYIKKKFVISALFFTLMAYIKLFPLIILLYFLKKRQFKIILWFGIFSLIFVILLPVLLTLSFNQPFIILKSWLINLLTPLPQNIIHLQSLKYLLLRYLTASDIYKINFLSISVGIASIIYYAISAVLVLGALFYKGWLKRNDEGLERELALIDINTLFLLSIILSPACSYQNYVYLLAPFLVLFMVGWDNLVNHAKFFWFSFIFVMLLNNLTRNTMWKKLGITTQGGFPFLVFEVLPIISLILYLFLLSLRLLLIKRPLKPASSASKIQ